MYWNLVNDDEFRPVKLLKLIYRKGDQIIQTFCKIDPPPEIRSPLFYLYKFQDSEKKYFWIMQNALKSHDKPWIWVYKTFKIQLQKGGPNNWDFLALLRN